MMISTFTCLCLGVKKNMQYESVISHIFDGKILSSVQCLYCERVSQQFVMSRDMLFGQP